MADFEFNVLTHSPERLNVISSRLGSGPADKYSDKDVKKAVKLASNSSHVLCVAGDEIQGAIDSVDAATNGGFSFGGVARFNRGARMDAVIGAGQGATPAKLDDLVVADDQLPVGTKGLAQVKTGEPKRHLWRIINVRGTGAAGTKVVLELL